MLYNCKDASPFVVLVPKSVFILHPAKIGNREVGGDKIREPNNGEQSLSYKLYYYYSYAT